MAAPIFGTGFSPRRAESAVSPASIPAPSVCVAPARFAIGIPNSFFGAPFETTRPLCAVRRCLGAAGARRRAPRLFPGKTATSRGRQFWHSTWRSLQGRRSIHPVSEKGRARSSAYACRPGFGGSAHSNIAIDFGFRGVGTTNSNSCASGTVSVGEALRYIRDDFADVIVAGGAEAPLTTITIGAFDIIKTMSRWPGDPALACRPFDLLRDGFVMGEGAASLIIEELEHARAWHPHLCRKCSATASTTMLSMTSPLPSGESCARAMRDALADARLAPEQIDYINAHASSTQLNDSANHVDQTSIWRTCKADPGQRNKRILCASARRHRRD